jgi:hypothetical protein
MAGRVPLCSVAVGTPVGRETRREARAAAACQAGGGPHDRLTFRISGRRGGRAASAWRDGPIVGRTPLLLGSVHPSGARRAAAAMAQLRAAAATSCR